MLALRGGPTPVPAPVPAMASSVAEQHLDAATPAPAAPTAPWRARRRGGAAVLALAAAASAAPSRVAAVEGQLAAIPVYAVTNAASEFVLVAGGGEGEGEGGKQQLGLLCFAERDAEALLAAVRAADPRMGKVRQADTRWDGSSAPVPAREAGCGRRGHVRGVQSRQRAERRVGAGALMDA